MAFGDLRLFYSIPVKNLRVTSREEIDFARRLMIGNGLVSGNVRRIIYRAARAIKARDESGLATVANGDKTIHFQIAVTLNTIQRVTIGYTVQAGKRDAVATIAGRRWSSLKSLCDFAVNETQRDKGVFGFRT
jgi:hypothetical protein